MKRARFRIKSTHGRRTRASYLAWAVLALAWTSVAFGHHSVGHPTPAALLGEIAFEQHVGAALPLDVPLRDEAGNTVQLARFFDGRPVVFAFVYYECPMLCTQVLNGLVRALRVLSFEPGKEFRIVALSIDPTESPAMAQAKKASTVRRYGRPLSAAGWHFLTGDAASVERLARAVGFRYAYDTELGQYAHAAGILVLTPEGRVARYFYGIDYPPRDLRLALVEASADRIGSVVDEILLYCYHYDPTTGRYGLVIMNVVRLGGVATVLAIGAFVWTTVRRERRTKPHAA